MSSLFPALSRSPRYRVIPTLISRKPVKYPRNSRNEVPGCSVAGFRSKSQRTLPRRTLFNNAPGERQLIAKPSPTVAGCTPELPSTPVQAGIRGTSPISRGIYLGFQVRQWARVRWHGRRIPGPGRSEDVLHQRLLHGGHHDGREQGRLRRGGWTRHAEAHPGVCLHLQPHGLRQLHGLSGKFSFFRSETAIVICLLHVVLTTNIKV